MTRNNESFAVVNRVTSKLEPEYVTELITALTRERRSELRRFAILDYNFTTTEEETRVIPRLLRDIRGIARSFLLVRESGLRIIERRRDVIARAIVLCGS